MSRFLLRSALILCVSAGSATAALAQQVSLTINNGRVTLKTQNASIRQILQEWTRVGGTTVVNAEKITGQPVTLTLVDVPEGQALETVLRSAAGYIVAEKQTPAATGSRYERIMIMARTTPVSSSPASTSASMNNAYTPNPMPPGGGVEQPVAVADEDNEPPAPTAPVVNPYAPGQNAPANANAVVPGMGTGLGQQQQQQQQQQQLAGAVGAPGQVNPTPTQNPQGAVLTPGYSNVYGTTGAVSSDSGAAGQAVTVNPPETKFDYANPQKYFQQRQQNGGTPQTMQPYPGVPLSSTGSGTNSSSTPANAGAGAPGQVNPTTPSTTTPSNFNPYSPNFNPYNLPPGSGVPGQTSSTPQTSVEPDRAKYANPYVQPGTATNPPQ